MTRSLRVLAALGAALLLAPFDGEQARAVGDEPEVKPAQSEPSQAVPSDTESWDRPQSIRGAAERLAMLHRAKGAKAAYELIDNCYRTHSLAETYGEGFETCIAQDYLETQTLIQVYSRLPPDALTKIGAPTPEKLASSMAERVSLAFRQYNKSQEYADGLKRLVDEYGVPVFLAIVFPEALRDAQEKKSKEKQ